MHLIMIPKYRQQTNRIAKKNGQHKNIFGEFNTFSITGRTSRLKNKQTNKKGKKTWTMLLTIMI